MFLCDIVVAFLLPLADVLEHIIVIFRFYCVLDAIVTIGIGLESAVGLQESATVILMKYSDITCAPSL